MSKVCSFFLQGRCRYGEKCWNEHPRGGGGGGGRGGGGGFGNRVWVNPQSQRSGGDYVQPSSFSRGGNDRGRVGEGDVKNFSFSTPNRFSSLSSQNSFEPRGSAPSDENEKHIELIQKDMEVWQSSGQWALSCYSNLKTLITGFVELSPEELRLEYYTRTASGDLQSYVNSVQQLANQWRSRVQELRTMSSSTRSAVISELNNPQTQPASAGGFYTSSSSGFGSSSSSSSGFGVGGFSSSTQSSAAFSFAASGSGFGPAGSQPTSSGFSSQPSSSGFGGFSSSASSSAPSASSFSFSAPVSKSSSGTFGSAAGFSFSSAAAAPAAGGFSSTPAGGSSLFSQASSSGGGFAGGPGAGGVSADNLYTPQSELTAEELKEFTAKRFTLGQIPLRPPPAELLIV